MPKEATVSQSLDPPPWAPHVLQPRWTGCSHRRRHRRRRPSSRPLRPGRLRSARPPWPPAGRCGASSASRRPSSSQAQRRLSGEAALGLFFITFNHFQHFSTHFVLFGGVSEDCWGWAHVVSGGLMQIYPWMVKLVCVPYITLALRWSGGL